MLVVNIDPSVVRIELKFNPCRKLNLGVALLACELYFEDLRVGEDLPDSRKCLLWNARFGNLAIGTLNLFYLAFDGELNVVPVGKLHLVVPVGKVGVKPHMRDFLFGKVLSQIVLCLLW